MHTKWRKGAYLGVTYAEFHLRVVYEKIACAASVTAVGDHLGHAPSETRATACASAAASAPYRSASTNSPGTTVRDPTRSGGQRRASSAVNSAMNGEHSAASLGSTTTQSGSSTVTSEESARPSNAPSA